MRNFIINKLYFIEINLINNLLRQVILIIFLVLISIYTSSVDCMDEAKAAIVHTIVNYNQLTEEEIGRLLECLQRVNELTPVQREELRQFINIFAGLAGIDLNSYLAPALQHNVPDQNMGNSGNPVSIENDPSREVLWQQRLASLGIFLVASVIISLFWYYRENIIEFLFDMSRRSLENIDWHSVVQNAAGQNNPAVNNALRVTLSALENMLTHDRPA